MRKLLPLLIFLFIPSACLSAPVFVEVDTQDCDGAGGASPCTEVSHAAGGAGTVTLVGQMSDDSTAGDRDTLGCTMSGVSMTRVPDAEIIGGAVEMDVFYTVAGTPGDIVCNWTGTVSGGGMITITFSSANATNIEDDNETSSASAAALQQTIAPTTFNTMVVDFALNANGSSSFTPDVDQIEPTGGDTATGQLTMATSYKIRGAPGTFTHGTTCAATAAMAYKVIAIKDANATSINSLGTLSLGVES